MICPDCSPPSYNHSCACTHTHSYRPQRGLIGKMSFVKRAEKAEVAHDGRNNGASRQTAMLVEINTANVQDKIAINDITALIDGKAAIRIAIVGKATSRPCSTTWRRRRSRWVEPQSTLMLKPSGLLLITRTSAPKASKTGLATEDAEPLAQSRPILTPEGRS